MCLRELIICMKVLETCFIETYPNRKLLNIVKEVILRIDNCLTDTRTKAPSLGGFSSDSLDGEVNQITRKIAEGKFLSEHDLTFKTMLILAMTKTL